MAAVIKERWDEFPQQVDESLLRVPLGVLEKISAFEIHTKDGERLACTVQTVDLTRHPTVNLPLAYVGGQRYYFLVKNKNDEVVAVRSLSLFDERARFLATSHIYVHSSYRGKRIAGPIDDEMVKILQNIANQKKKKVFWRVENENIATLNEYKAKPDADPAVVAARELEQERWMTLYCPSGRFSKRTFEPEVNVEDVGEATHTQIGNLL